MPDCAKDNLLDSIDSVRAVVAVSMEDGRRLIGRLCAAKKTTPAAAAAMEELYRPVGISLRLNRRRFLRHTPARRRQRQRGGRRRTTQSMSKVDRASGADALAHAHSPAWRQHVRHHQEHSLGHPYTMRHLYAMRQCPAYGRKIASRGT